MRPSGRGRMGNAPPGIAGLVMLRFSTSVDMPVQKHVALFCQMHTVSFYIAVRHRLTVHGFKFSPHHTGYNK